MSKLRVVFTGTGYMGQIAHLLNYSALTDECEVVAVADVRPSVVQSVAQRYAVPKAYTDMYEMLDKEQYDAIVCIQNFGRHEALLPDILSIGKPVMLEKPIALNYNVGMKLADIARLHNTPVMVGYHKLSDPATELAKTYVDDFKKTQKYGRMREVRVTMADGDWGYCGIVPGVISSDEPCPPVAYEAPNPNFNQEQQGYHGHVVNYYIHQINYMRHMMGEPYDIEYVSKDGVILVATGKETGVNGVLEMAPYYSSPEWDEGTRVSFDNAYVTVDLPAPLSKIPGKVHVRTPEGINAPLMPPNYAMLNEARNFIKFAKGEAPAPCDIYSACEDLRIAEKVVKYRFGLK